MGKYVTVLEESVLSINSSLHAISKLIGCVYNITITESILNFVCMYSTYHYTMSMYLDIIPPVWYHECYKSLSTYFNNTIAVVFSK